jgi:hypothetical protein
MVIEFRQQPLKAVRRSAHPRRAQSEAPPGAGPGRAAERPPPHERARVGLDTAWEELRTWPTQMGKALAAVERNARAMASPVDDLLDSARLERGESSPRRERLETVEVLEAVRGSFEPQASARGVALEARVESGECRVEGDRGRLERAAGNLVADALTFTPRGGRVEVRLGRGPGRVEVRTRDTGRGIAPALLPNAFERHAQGREGGGLGAAERGAGLGLALVRHVVGRHGGPSRRRARAEASRSPFTCRWPSATRRRVDSPFGRRWRGTWRPGARRLAGVRPASYAPSARGAYAALARRGRPALGGGSPGRRQPVVGGAAGGASGACGSPVAFSVPSTPSVTCPSAGSVPPPSALLRRRSAFLAAFSFWYS